MLHRRDIILECAKALENIPNEDGLLYSSYLKLEENRILSQIQQDLQTYGRNHPGKQKEITTFVEQLEASKLSVSSEKGTHNPILNRNPDVPNNQIITDYLHTKMSSYGID